MLQILLCLPGVQEQCSRHLKCLAVTEASSVDVRDTRIYPQVTEQLIHAHSRQPLQLMCSHTHTHTHCIDSRITHQHLQVVINKSMLLF